jgi:hypothetical protein
MWPVYSIITIYIQCAVTNFILWSSGKCCLCVGVVLCAIWELMPLSSVCKVLLDIVIRAALRASHSVVWRLRSHAMNVMRFCSTWAKLFSFGVRSSAHTRYFNEYQTKNCMKNENKIICTQGPGENVVVLDRGIQFAIHRCAQKCTLCSNLFFYWNLSKCWH